MQINVRNFNTETEIVKLKCGDTFYAPRSCPDEKGRKYNAFYMVVDSKSFGSAFGGTFSAKVKNNALAVNLETGQLRFFGNETLINAFPLKVEKAFE